MPFESKPSRLAPRQPAGSIAYRVQDGEDWQSVAIKFKIDVNTLIRFNFQTNNTDEVNWYLREYVGCRISKDGGRNWAFSSSANPGRIYIPFDPTVTLPESILPHEPCERTVITNLNGPVRLYGFFPSRASGPWVFNTRPFRMGVASPGFWNCATQFEKEFQLLWGSRPRGGPVVDVSTGEPYSVVGHYLVRLDGYNLHFQQTHPRNLGRLPLDELLQGWHYDEHTDKYTYFQPSPVFVRRNEPLGGYQRFATSDSLFDVVTDIFGRVVVYLKEDSAFPDTPGPWKTIIVAAVRALTGTGTMSLVKNLVLKF